MLTRVKILTKLWFLYFLMCIGGLGFVTAFMLFFPLGFLSRWLPGLRGHEDGILKTGVTLLMRAQPWYHSELAIDLPDHERVLLVSNHRSHLDVFILLSRVPGIRILAKSSLFKIPFLGLMMRATKQIGVERGRFDAWTRAMETVRQRLREGETVHIFPEMTRCEKNFASVNPFVAAPFFVAMQEGATIVPLVFKNTDRVWPKGEVGLHFREKVEARTLPAVNARDFASAESLRNEVHRRIVEALA
ncbi:MAG TPA: lysophospholipid acyltransferase family protein [Bdellovibrionales bacterium]|nr:lysophospholipid acyltransferase family protein [Bdellovibrionales bacterium]